MCCKILVSLVSPIPFQEKIFEFLLASLTETRQQCTEPSQYTPHDILSKMHFSLTTALLWTASLASAGIVITPISDNMLVPKTPGDCFFGVVTPQGCGPKRA
ncbi:hypothetical protein LMH87_002347 [Akanthomyces muscarius]|uniref:Uncharacterized protein n=1 Tax=Akanthomyces muscarius TaxID=2231603 RepID=A0A9W8Q852_AKAMU|nr:hypothetical protein LMH87_002347 [Akanthomyces muscarius]KAJ4147845.1 hypothetical protein LMH87_002347 [Akanthomyces muscarius]